MSEVKLHSPAVEEHVLLPKERVVKDGPLCLSSKDGFTCTRGKGHKGRHIAHGFKGHMVASWGGRQ